MLPSMALLALQSYFNGTLFSSMVVLPLVWAYHAHSCELMPYILTQHAEDLGPEWTWSTHWQSRFQCLENTCLQTDATSVLLVQSCARLCSWMQLHVLKPTTRENKSTMIGVIWRSHRSTIRPLSLKPFRVKIHVIFVWNLFKEIKHLRNTGSFFH